jgi:acylphosphatase
MKLVAYPLAVLFAGGLIFAAAILTAGEASAQQQAITGTVSGEAIQKVGFRAMIQKQAIMYDLAGYARNVPDGTVSISLQGDKDRIDKALAAIRVGSKKSSRNNVVNAASAPLDSTLDVSSRALMGHPCRVIRRMRYGTGSSRERHDDRGGPSSDTT